MSSFACGCMRPSSRMKQERFAWYLCQEHDMLIKERLTLLFKEEEVKK